MKKAKIIIALILIFFLIYFLQSNFFNWFVIFGVKPNLFVILVLFIGLFMGQNYGVCFGIAFGLILDFLIGRNIGISSVMFGIVGIMGGYIDKNFSKDSRITIMLMVAITTIIFELGEFIIQNFILSYAFIEIDIFAKTLLIEVLYNIILTVILYPLLKNGGFYIEGNFKENNILTRYF